MKKVGFGTISLLLFVLAIVWSFSYQRTFCLGDTVLRFLGLKAWSNGNTGIHYTVFYSFVFLIPGFLLSRKHKDHFAANLGGFLSAIFGLFLLLSIFGLSV